MSQSILERIESKRTVSEGYLILGRNEIKELGELISGMKLYAIPEDGDRATEFMGLKVCEIQCNNYLEIVPYSSVISIS